MGYIKTSERLGKTGINKYGSEMVIIEYHDAQNIKVQFKESKHIVKTSYDNFLKKKVRNPYDKTVYGVGYLGVGNYKTGTHQYTEWAGMLQRCYDPKMQRKRPRYIGCIVCEEWLNLQNFGRWYDNNFYQIKYKTMNLDKDILIKGNKIYSPNTCVFVPNNINMLFTKHNAKRGQLPIGVCFNTKSKMYQANCRVDKKDNFLGFFKTPESAFYTYKLYKENIIKSYADKYKNEIPSILYDAMYNYQVEITD